MSQSVKRYLQILAVFSLNSFRRHRRSFFAGALRRIVKSAGAIVAKPNKFLRAGHKLNYLPKTTFFYQNLWQDGSYAVYRIEWLKAQRGLGRWES